MYYKIITTLDDSEELIHYCIEHKYKDFLEALLVSNHIIKESIQIDKIDTELRTDEEKPKFSNKFGFGD